MATTVMLALWGYTASKASYAQADIAPTENIKSNIASGESYDEVEALMDSNNIAGVVAKLSELNKWPKDAELPVRVSANRNREKIAKKLLRMDGLSESDRVFAIDALIESLAAIYGLDFYYNLNDRLIADQFQTVAQSHLNDTDDKIVRSAELALLKLHAFEFLKSKSPSDEQYQGLEDSVFHFLTAYSNDSLALSNVKLIFKSMSHFKPDVCVKLTNLLVGKRTEYTGTKADQLVADLADASLMLETRYETLFENRWVNGQAGRDQLMRVSLKLLSNQSAGRAVIEKVDQVAQWFEQQNKLDRAGEIYQALVDEANRPNDPVATKTANKLGRNGLIRCDAVGQAIEFTGVDIQGRPLSTARFKGRIVAVVFWSVNDTDSIDELVQLHREKAQYSSLPAETIAICIENNPGKVFVKTVESLKRFIICDPAEYSSAGIPFMKQVPVTQVPQIILIDPNGNLSDTNVPGDNLRSHIEHLASKR